MKEKSKKNLKLSHGFFNLISGYKGIEFHKTERKFSGQNEEYVENEWQRLIESNEVKFSSQLIALCPEMTEVREKILHVTGYKTDYKHYRTTLEHPNLRVWITGPSGITTVYHNDEEFYIIGERANSTTQIGGSLEFVPGGYLEAAHFEKQNPFAETIYQELEEETGIERSHVSKINQFWTGQLRKHPESNRLSQDVCIDLRLDIEGISPNQIKKKFEGLRKKEHNSLQFIPVNQIRKYAETNWNRFSLRGRCSLMHLLNKR